MNYFNHFTFSPLITAIATFILGLFVLFKGRWKKSLYVIFALYTFSISLWSFCATRFTPDFQDPYLIWGRLLHLGAILIPAFFIHFVSEFLGEKNRKIMFISYLIAGIFLGFNFFTRLFIKGTTNKAFYSYPTPSSIYPFYFTFFIICVFFGLYKLFRASLIATGTKRNQIKYLLWSSMFGYLGGLKNFMILVGLEIFPIYPYGTYAMPIYVLVVTIAIIKYRLLDINIALTRAGIFAISTMKDRYSNPSVLYMEWVGDWNLVYRDEEEFKHIFLEAGFDKDELKTEYEQQGIMQYIIASNKARADK